MSRDPRGRFHAPNDFAEDSEIQRILKKRIDEFVERLNQDFGNLTENVTFRDCARQIEAVLKEAFGAAASKCIVGSYRRNPNPWNNYLKRNLSLEMRTSSEGSSQLSKDIPSLLKELLNSIGDGGNETAIGEQEPTFNVAVKRLSQRWNDLPQEDKDSFSDPYLKVDDFSVIHPEWGEEADKRRSRAWTDVKMRVMRHLLPFLILIVF